MSAQLANAPTRSRAVCIDVLTNWIEIGSIRSAMLATKLIWTAVVDVGAHQHTSAIGEGLGIVQQDIRVAAELLVCWHAASDTFPWIAIGERSFRPF